LEVDESSAGWTIRFAGQRLRSNLYLLGKSIAGTGRVALRVTQDQAWGPGVVVRQSAAGCVVVVPVVVLDEELWIGVGSSTKPYGPDKFASEQSIRIRASTIKEDANQIDNQPGGADATRGCGGSRSGGSRIRGVASGALRPIGNQRAGHQY
jgi:hypothetical protein